MTIEELIVQSIALIRDFACPGVNPNIMSIGPVPEM